MGCSPTFCSTPYILSDGDCCPDKNNDGTCDQQQELAPEEKQFLAVRSPPTSPDITSPSSNKNPKEKYPTTEKGVLLTINADDDPFQGDEHAKVLLIEFGDYTDPSSQRFQKEVLPEILKKYGSKIKYVFRNYPEINNENAQLAAEASECANEQGKFWTYHDYLFTQSYRLTLSSLRKFAAETELDMDTFETCFFSHRYKDEVLHDKEEGLRYGVSHTPTFFLNNQKIVGYKTFDTFDTYFEDVFYEDFQTERGTTITARSTGLAYAILPGPAALDPLVTESPYSNRLELIDAVFSVSGTDITPRDSGTSKDTASLAVTYSSKRGSLTGKDIYTIELKQLLTEGVSHTFYGGVGTDVAVHGNTGIGTRYLPRSDAYLTLWGLADVKKNGEPLVENAFVHFMITHGIRDDKNTLLQKQEDEDIEAYLLVSSQDKQKLPFDGGFLYLFWPDANLQQS